jgi:hypothetical protein
MGEPDFSRVGYWTFDQWASTGLAAADDDISGWRAVAMGTNFQSSFIRRNKYMCTPLGQTRPGQE